MAWAPHCVILLPVVYFVMLLFALVWNIIFFEEEGEDPRYHAPTLVVSMWQILTWLPHLSL